MRFLLPEIGRHLAGELERAGHGRVSPRIRVRVAPREERDIPVPAPARLTTGAARTLRQTAAGLPESRLRAVLERLAARGPGGKEKAPEDR
jgi:hypothetical protein